MGKPSKNLGLAKACPECRKILITAANVQGIGKFKTKCPHCKSLIEVTISQKSSITLTKLLLILIFVGIFFTSVYIHKTNTILEAIATDR